MFGNRGHRSLRFSDDTCLPETGAVAVCLATSLYHLIVGPLKNYAIAQKVISCGWLGWIIPLLAFWSLSMLTMKYVAIRRRYRLLNEELLPMTIAESVSPATAPLFLRYLQGRFGNLESHPLLHRLQGVLLRLANGQPCRDAAVELQDQARLDADQANVSYSMVRAFLWALPILGFIGTCIGIGEAIGGFSKTLKAANNLMKIKDSLQVVVGGLAMAFNVTLMGLFSSLAVVLPMNVLQRTEFAFLSAVDRYCAVHLTRRLRDDADAENDASSSISTRQ